MFSALCKARVTQQEYKPPQHWNPMLAQPLVQGPPECTPIQARLRVLVCANQHQLKHSLQAHAPRCLHTSLPRMPVGPVCWRLTPSGSLTDFGSPSIAPTRTTCSRPCLHITAAHALGSPANQHRAQARPTAVCARIGHFQSNNSCFLFAADPSSSLEAAAGALLSRSSSLAHGLSGGLHLCGGLGGSGHSHDAGVAVAQVNHGGVALWTGERKEERAAQVKFVSCLCQLLRHSMQSSQWQSISVF